MTDLTVETLLEEKRIERVLVRYALALDEHDWAGLDEVFVPEATAWYQGIGDFSSRDAIRDMISGVLQTCGRTQHLLGNFRIAIDGNKATAKCYLQAIHVGQGALAAQTMTVWGEYSDRLERRPEGWRIVHRELAMFQTAGDIGLGTTGAE